MNVIGMSWYDLKDLASPALSPIPIMQIHVKHFEDWVTVSESRIYENERYGVCVKEWQIKGNLQI